MKQIGLIADCKQQHGYERCRNFATNFRKMLIHRLVAETFIAGRSLSKQEAVHHKDFNKLNNAYDNLEICTVAENNSKQDRIDQNFRRLKPIEQLVCLRLILIDGLTVEEMSSLTGLSINTIIAAKAGRGWALFTDYPSYMEYTTS